MSEVERTLLAPIAAVRAYLVLRGTLLLLAIDVWMTHLGPAWRYGAAGFNVPHFAWMGALPITTTAAYVGGIVLVSGLSILAATLERPPRALLLAIAALYTWGWSSSMLDSYQHHYLLSWMLVAFAAYPTHDATALFGGPRSERPHGIVPRSHAWGPKLTWILCAVVYAYTAVSKTEPEWRNGEALRNITHDGATIPGAIEMLSNSGWSGDDVWPFLGASTIAVQIVCALGYLGALVRDGFVPGSTPARVMAGVATAALFAAVSFHVGAEVMGLEIGWFSYYMILVAIASFAPASWLGWITVAITWPSRSLVRTRERPHAILLGVGGVFVLGAVAVAANEAALPGVAGGFVVLVLAAAAVAVATLRTSPTSRALLAALVALATTAAVMSAALRVGHERYDYWRFAGGDFRRRGETERALEAYRHALDVAPEEAEEGSDETEPPRERMARRVRELEAAVEAGARP